MLTFIKLISISLCSLGLLCVICSNKYFTIWSFKIHSFLFVFWVKKFILSKTHWLWFGIKNSELVYNYYSLCYIAVFMMKHLLIRRLLKRQLQVLICTSYVWICYFTVGFHWLHVKLCQVLGSLLWMRQRIVWDSASILIELACPEKDKEGLFRHGEAGRSCWSNSDLNESLLAWGFLNS